MSSSDKKNQSPLHRQLFLTHNKYQNSPEECEYCLKKQKLSAEGQSQRCLQHSMAYQKSFSNQSNSQSSRNIIEDALDMLSDVQQILQQYWNNLHQYSKGSSDKVRIQLTPVFESISRIQQKLGRFPIQDHLKPFPKHETKRQKGDFDFEEKKQTRSQKIITQNFDQLFSDISTNDQIKEWVIYFQKILVNHQLTEQLLPFDDQVGMRIFKESMQKKFIIFAKNYDRYEKKLTVALQKLLFYMESCGTAVSDKIIKEDIKFIEQCDMQKVGSAEISYSMLLLQAMTIEDLLAQRQQRQQY